MRVHHDNEYSVHEPILLVWPAILALGAVAPRTQRRGPPCSAL